MEHFRQSARIFYASAILLSFAPRLLTQGYAPEVGAKKVTVPEGFAVRLIAAEPRPADGFEITRGSRSIQLSATQQIIVPGNLGKYLCATFSARQRCSCRFSHRLRRKK